MIFTISCDARAPPGISSKNGPANASTVR
jgi:hypothetical protein